MSTPSVSSPQALPAVPGGVVPNAGAINAANQPGQNPNVYASASLYVGDLNPDVTEALLFEIFNAVGAVASVRVCRDVATRRSLGYAYVNFHRVDDAERALDTMNFTNIRGRACRIMWSHRDPTLRKNGTGNIFVKNLAPSIDNKTLFDTFSMFGNILSCKVATDASGNSLGYGFVHYETDESAAAAVENVNGNLILEVAVSVEPFRSRRERGTDKQLFTNVFVKNLPEDATEQKLRDLFTKFGTITSVVCALDEEKSKCKGYGFVCFTTPEEAAAAVDQLNGADFGDKKIYVGRAQKKDEREKELRERFEQVRLERQKKYAGVNLYVKNLADTIDKDRLTQEFAKFGDITSVRIMMDGEKSRGFGFVCFSTPEEATKAVTAMSGHMLDGKPLYVSLAQRKEVRRAHLEAQHAQRVKMGVPQAMYAQTPMGFYPPVNARLMYPQQMMAPRRWPQGQVAGRAGPPMVGMPMPPYMNVVQPGGPAGGKGKAPLVQQQQMGGGPMQGGPIGMQQQGGRGGNRGAQNQNFKYTAQARNNQGRIDGGGQVSPNSMAAKAGPLAQLIQELAQVPEVQQKHMIGERLFPLIHLREPVLAGKITGMLLEMDNGELFNLLESSEALNDKVAEAINVLHHHEMEMGADQEAQDVTPQ